LNKKQIRKVKVKGVLVTEKHIVVCEMQLEMVEGEKSRDAVKGCWRKHAE